MGWAETWRRWTVAKTDPQPLPTADYYFLAAMRDLVAGHGNTDGRPIVRFGANAWAHDDRLVIIRYVAPEEMARIEHRRWRSVHYVIDDLIPEAGTSLELPADYRAKLARFATTLLPRILALQPTIVAPSQAILDAFPSLPRRRLDPCCLATIDGPLPPPTAWTGDLRIAFLGTRSHAGSLPLLQSIAERLQRDCPAARLHVFFGRHLPASLARCPTIVNRKPVPWPQFPAFCRGNTFHIGLAPVQDTAFAQARSITKLMDHAAVGAVGIYSDRVPFKDLITHGRTGLLVGDSDETWMSTILELAAAPDRMDAMARASGELAADLGAPARIRRFWMQELGLNQAPREWPSVAMPQAEA